MSDFWISSGHQLLDRDDLGRLVLTDEFLKAYFARPELVPPPEACDAERALHGALLLAPRRAVDPAEIAGLADPDARENWDLMLAFRDALVAAPSLEAAYLDLVRSGAAGRTPPLFVNQLTQVILRNALDGCEDAFTLRAGELFFRPQRASVHEGALLLADAETVELREEKSRSTPLLAMFADPVETELDVLDEDNADTYGHRNEAFDLVLSLAGGVQSRAGLGRVIEAWIGHLLGVGVIVTPIARVDESDWAWFVGLDAEATRVGNQLWRGEDADEEALARIIAIFELRFADPNEALPQIGARPVYLFLGQTRDRLVRLKPQNLITGMPLRTPAQAS